MSNPEYQNIWVALRFGTSATSRIEAIQARVEEFLPDGFNREQSPHLSVIPGARIPGTKYSQLAEFTDEMRIDESAIRVTGLSLYPVFNPYVIRLDVDINLREIRSQLIDRIYEIDGSLLYPPATPHITLFKTGNDKTMAPQMTYPAYRNLHQGLAALNDEITNFGFERLEIDFQEF